MYRSLVTEATREHGAAIWTALKGIVLYLCQPAVGALGFRVHVTSTTAHKQDSMSMQLIQ